MRIAPRGVNFVVSVALMWRSKGNHTDLMNPVQCRPVLDSGFSLLLLLLDIGASVGRLMHVQSLIVGGCLQNHLLTKFKVSSP